MSEIDEHYMRTAVSVAQEGHSQGGIPIGAVLVHFDPKNESREGKIIGRGFNQRVQSGSAILHAEMAALESAGRQAAHVYRECVMYTTLSPCCMCSGAIRLYKIPRVVAGENRTFVGDEAVLEKDGIRVHVLQNEECVTMMADFITNEPGLWNEDIGVTV